MECVVAHAEPVRAEQQRVGRCDTKADFVLGRRDARPAAAEWIDLVLGRSHACATFVGRRNSESRLGRVIDIMGTQLRSRDDGLC